jgi:hypothetical protein
MPFGRTNCHFERRRSRILLGPASLPLTPGIDRWQDVAGEVDTPYQIIDAVMARSLRRDAARTHPLSRGSSCRTYRAIPVPGWRAW